MDDDSIRIYQIDPYVYFLGPTTTATIFTKDDTTPIGFIKNLDRYTNGQNERDLG